jgi:hypothetical protein
MYAGRMALVKRLAESAVRFPPRDRRVGRGVRGQEIRGTTES